MQFSRRFLGLIWAQTATFRRFNMFVNNHHASLVSPSRHYPMATLCIWGMDTWRRPAFWQLLQRYLGSHVRHVKKVSRVCQRKDGKVRFDLRITSSRSDYIREQLEKGKEGWGMRFHIPWEKRRANSKLISPPGNLSKPGGVGKGVVF